MIKLIIFGLDGVLVDTNNIHYESLLDAIKTVTHLPQSKYAHLIEKDGNPTKHKLASLKVHLNLTDLDIQLIDDQKQQNVIRHLFRGLKSSPKQSIMLETLLEDYMLAVASNSRKENVINILNILGITSFFNKILSGTNVTNYKPDPEIFLTIMNFYEITPDETLILEDSEMGKCAAIATGAHLLEINDIASVSLENIKNKIKRIGMQ